MAKWYKISVSVGTLGRNDILDMLRYSGWVRDIEIDASGERECVLSYEFANTSPEMVEERWRSFGVGVIGVRMA